jgi:hypothetical protein
VVVALAASACGSSVEGGGSGGGGSGGGGTGGQGGQLPAECAVETSEPAPHQVALHFQNPGADPVFLREDCSLNFSILSCADGYTDPLSRSGSCSIECGDPTGGCIACGACPLYEVAVPAGGQHTDAWSGHHYTYDTGPDGCTCHNEHFAPAGRYRVRVPVFTTPEGALNGPPDYEATADFELPAPGGVVEISLAPPP